MSDISIIADCCGICSICIYSGLAKMCTQPCGADECCGGPRGCCGSCCDSSFNEDDLDERLKKQQAKNNANAVPVNSQPTPSQGMSQVTEEPKPTNSEA